MRGADNRFQENAGYNRIQLVVSGRRRFRHFRRITTRDIYIICWWCVYVGLSAYNARLIYTSIPAICAVIVRFVPNTLIAFDAPRIMIIIISVTPCCSEA